MMAAKVGAAVVLVLVVVAAASVTAVDVEARVGGAKEKPPVLKHVFKSKGIFDQTAYGPLKEAPEPCNWEHKRMMRHKKKDHQTEKHRFQSPVPNDGMMLTNHKTVLVLYQMMKDIHDVFTQNHVNYYVTSGTLLGAVRHKGLIPWDDDLDLSIQEADFERVNALADTFRELDYVLMPYGGGFKLFPREGCRIHGKPFRYPFADIFRVGRAHGRTYYTHTKRWPNCFFKTNEVGPLRLYQFGSIHVYGAHDPVGFLDRCYGDWNKVGALGEDHLTYRDNSDHFRPLDDLPHGPAEPEGPLLERMKQGETLDSM
eukprot:TRINITY_DN85588_c0_g1_i1.p1 TRINITY_DN85588_c0_g1~~TRINITY_DN85588_c0_g1_i1.p1  ORF type:complete len:313 (-),score=111.00 TRINITY_DN85588_c0_g1_i1:111-1049(-)